MVPPEGFERRRLAEREVERVHVPAGAVAHAAGIGVRGDVRAQAVAVEHLEVVVAVAAPERLLGLELAHVAGGQRGEDLAVLEVAGDGVARHALADDRVAFLDHAAGEARRLGAEAALDRVEAGVQAVDDLPAVAARGAPADARAFEQGDGVAPLGERDAGGEAGVAAADDGDVDLRVTLQRRARRRGVRRGGVVGGGVGVGAGVGVPRRRHHTVSR
jgi:hypothetical protein